MDTPQIYDRVRPRKFAPPIIRPSESTIRAKRREISVRYRASGYKPTITDLRRGEIARLAIFRRDFEYPNGELLYAIEDNPPRLKAKTLGRQIKLTDFERSECKIKTIQPYDISAEDHRVNRLYDKRYRQRLFAQKKRREQGAVPRKLYQRASLAQRKPWEIMGMSRRNWYRKGKPTPDCGTGPSTNTLTYLSVDALVPIDLCPI